MLDLLHLDVQAAVGVEQADVVLAFLALEPAQLHAERGAPEFRRLRQVGGLAVDDESGEAALVHGGSATGAR